MAKTLNIKFKWDNKGLVSAVKWIQWALHGAEKSLKEFKADLASLGTSMNKIVKNARSMNNAVKKAATGVDGIWDEAKKSASEVDRLNKSLSKMWGTTGNKMFSGMSAWFKWMGRDIVRATKLMGTFAAITGGIQLRRATSDYLDFSNEMTVLSNIANPYNNQVGKEELYKGINQAAAKAGVNPAEFVAQVSPIVSWAIPINIGKDTTDKEAATQVQEVTAALWELWLWAKWHWGTIGDASELYTRMMLSDGYMPEDLKNPENIIKWLGMMSSFMDESVWDLHTLSTWISRVVLTWMSVQWATIEWVLARYARGTKLKSVMLASRHTSALSRSETSQLNESHKASNKVIATLKWKKDSEWVFQPFTMGTQEKTNKVRKFLQGYDSTAEVKNKLFSVEWEDWELISATPEEALWNYMDAMKKAEKIWLNAGEFLSMIQWAQEVRQELMSA